MDTIRQTYKYRQFFMRSTWDGHFQTYNYRQIFMRSTWVELFYSVRWTDEQYKTQIN